MAMFIILMDMPVYQHPVGDMESFRFLTVMG
jgi:hypothetical protein